MLAAYVSGHGFGHATRLFEVLRAIRARAPGLALSLTGTVPEWLVRRDVPGEVLLRPLACDVGLAQRDALRVDEPATAARCAAFDAAWDGAVAREAAFLATSGARAVLADVPALPFAAAARAGLPALALANFGWDAIYAHLARRQPSLAASAARAAEAYRTAALLLELPFAFGLDAFPRRAPVGLVARRPRLPRDEARRRLGLDDRPAVLVSFGGIGLPALGPDAVRALAGRYRFLFPPELEAERLAALGVGYADVVRAADAVVTKPGYGIVSDAIAAGTRLVYTERGDFPEYDVLVAEMPRHLACVHVPHAELLAGRLEAPLERVLAMPVPPAPDLGGAERAAERVLAALG
jgi:L-arabinokinase